MTDLELVNDVGQLGYNLTPSNANATADSTGTAASWAVSSEYFGPKDSILPRELRQNLHKHFARIEREFEREYRRLYGENLALQERLEKFEDGDHSESTTLAKKLGASMLSQRIKQQYKQSTSRLVSSLRQSSGHSSTPVGVGTAGVATSVPSNPMISSTVVVPSTTVPSTNSSVFAGTFAGHGGSWQLMHRLCAHRDGVWEVTPYRRFLATASADTTVRLWTNDIQMNCLLVYLGHSGSVNSVRFRNRDHLLLTSSGDGTAHLVRLPFDLLVKAATSLSAGSTPAMVAATLEAAASALATEVAGSTNMAVGNTAAPTVKSGLHSGFGLESDDGTHGQSNVHAANEEGSPIRTACNPSTLVPIHVRHPHGIFQSINLGPAGSFTCPPGMSSASVVNSNTMESSPLSAADFLTGRDHLVTAGWDRLGRIYDASTGQEISLLTGHDHQLTDVRCAPEGAPLVVTSSRDCTFRVWDFRQPGMRVHVQQAHTQTISTTQFLTGCASKRLISAGGDHLCRLWDLRQTRGPLVSIRTDSGINRLAISGTGFINTAPANDAVPDMSSTTSASGSTNIPPTGVEMPIPSETTTTSGGLTSAASTNTQVWGALTTAPPPATVSSAPTWSTSHIHILALPLNNRGIKFFDLNGNRIGRLVRSTSRGHSRMVTSVAWADEGACNFFSTGFDSHLLAWQIHLGNM